MTANDRNTAVLDIIAEALRAERLHPNLGVPELRPGLRGAHNLNAGAYQATNSRTPTWETILLEEVYEALAATTPEDRRNELVQVAAVCARWIERLDA